MISPGDISCENEIPLKRKYSLEGSNHTFNNKNMEIIINNL